jgi:hypothetical protein
VKVKVKKLQDHWVIDSKTNPKNLGLTLRTQRPGAESELLQKFIERFKIRIPNGHKVTIFKEPRIASGYPDLVIVVWNAIAAEKWHPLRTCLQSADLRVLHFLSSQEKFQLSDLISLFGEQVILNVYKLEASQLIRLRGKTIYSRQLSKVYAVRHIFAVEAKISEWKGALEQASLNRWFATSSNILMPKVPRGSMLLAQAETLGIGVWSIEDSILDARFRPTSPSPVSYASWLFNEWVWRAHTEEMELKAIVTALLG